MLAQNRKHVMAVTAWGGGACALLAAASLAAFPPLVGASILLGGALSIVNVYSIVMVVEALAAAALTSGAPTGAAKFVAGAVHVLKLLIITAALVLLVVFKLADLFGLLAGFTVVLAAHVFTGLKRFAGDTDVPE